ncbi:phosphoglucosamine mutase [Natrarchaeobius halalkaliphilus]|uniref:Phosphoglucosamine mutase n=1 Tax=Natrarchaeobius halalkaliphilus TaxID=1679091 RepID=A0A3N6P913_9EURY|nr:phosphoglucosamine mutase [Natrarchaeobius halalkaliphilus]RQG92705.1 phosphoglucosamine mutase [Natrarchaeobius halalkaliphilus]
MEVFGSSGTRGVANEELTPEFVLRVGKATGTAWGVDRVAIARDTRYTGRMLADAATSGLASTGTDVDRLGILPTPGAQFHAERAGVPVVVITASHNPPQYNGIKLVGTDGVELAVSDLETIEETLLSERFAVAPWDETGRVREITGTTDQYVDELLAAAERETIAGADLTVALDPGHGAGALTSPRFFRELGCRVVTVNGQADGRFPGRDPEPVPENLGDLGELVRASDADVGIAHDGDADRAIFFDEDGEYVPGDATLAALAAAELEAGDTVVSAVNVSQRLVDVVTDLGAELELTPIGSTNIITRIRELEASGARVPIAGEGNGGIFFPAFRLARDGAFTAARFLELVAERSVSEIVSPFDGYANVRHNLEYESTAERDAMLDAAANHAQSADAELNTRDGYRLDYGDAWVLARPSGTEPLVRVYAEARDAGRAQELADELYETLADAKANA